MHAYRRLNQFRLIVTPQVVGKTAIPLFRELRTPLALSRRSLKRLGDEHSAVHVPYDVQYD